MATALQNVVQSTKYPPEAFLFVQRGLDYTVRHIYGDDEDADEPQHRHISGEQLCYGLRDFCVQQYGLLARTVLRRWHIESCEDFGRIVFAMVDADLMHKTEGDSIRDFIGVFDFSEAFSPQLSLSENS